MASSGVPRWGDPLSGSTDDINSPSWRGLGGCFPASQFRGAPVCTNRLPVCPHHHWDRPTVAFVIAGQARSFLDESGWQTYQQHVLKSFYANAESRVFLHLKLGRGPNLNRRWQELGRAVETLRPAVVRTTLRRDVELRESVFDRAGSRGRTHPQHPECFWRDVAPHFQLSRAGIWWLTMEQAWESVTTYERDNGFLFDAVVFSRPDITFHKAMGPWYASVPHPAHSLGALAPCELSALIDTGTVFAAGVVTISRDVGTRRGAR